MLRSPLRNMFFLTLVCLSSFGNSAAEDMIVDGQIERSIVVVTASYNNQRWYKKNLDSVLSQKYTNYCVIYVDDCSPDRTGDLVEEYLVEQGQKWRVALIKNKERHLAMENIYNAVHSCDDKDIVIILDGDDWLAHDGVFAHLNRVYADPDVWITYGQYQEYPSYGHGFNEPIPAHIVRANAFRQQYNAFSHLRSFYAGLFKKISREDLMYQGRFLAMSADIASMLPMMEMAGSHFRFIPDILYTYNGENVINDHKISKELQRGMDLHVRSRPKYKKLSTLF